MDSIDWDNDADKDLLVAHGEEMLANTDSTNCWVTVGELFYWNILGSFAARVKSGAYFIVLTAHLSARPCDRVFDIKNALFDLICL